MIKKAGFAIFITTLTLMLSLPVGAQNGKKCMRPQSSDIVTLKGEITNILNPLASFKAEDGKEYQVHLGPVWYWKQENLDIKKGNVTITGILEDVDSSLHLYPNKIMQGGEEIVLASEKGIPKWCNAKSGQGKSHRHHKKDCCGKCRKN